MTTSKEIDFDSIKLLYHTDWYDGPMEGMGELEGQRVWYELEDEDWSGKRRIRKFSVYRPSEQQIKERDHWHTEFMRIVYGGKLFDDSHALSVQAGWESFYEPYKVAKEIFQKFNEDQLVAVAIETGAKLEDDET